MRLELSRTTFVWCFQINPQKFEVSFSEGARKENGTEMGVMVDTSCSRRSHSPIHQRLPSYPDRASLS